MRNRSSLDQSSETAEQRVERLRRERELITEAETEAAAGLLVPQLEANAWIESLGTDHPLPRPKPRSPGGPIAAKA